MFFWADAVNYLCFDSRSFLYENNWSKFIFIFKNKFCYLALFDVQRYSNLL